MTRNSEINYYKLNECVVTPIKDLNPIRKEYLRNRRRPQNLTWRSFNFMDVKDQLEKDGYEIDIVGTTDNMTEVNIRKPLSIPFSNMGELLEISSNEAHQLIKRLEGIDNINFPELQQYYVNISELDNYVYLLPRDTEVAKKDLDVYLEDISPSEDAGEKPFTLSFIEYIVTISDLNIPNSSPFLTNLNWDLGVSTVLNRDNVTEIVAGTKLYLDNMKDYTLVAIGPVTDNLQDVIQYNQFPDTDYWDDMLYFVPVIDKSATIPKPGIYGFTPNELDNGKWFMELPATNTPDLSLNWLNSSAEPLTMDNIERVKKGTKLYLTVNPDVVIIAIAPATDNYNSVAQYDQYKNRTVWEDSPFLIPVIDIDDVHKSPYLMGFDQETLDNNTFSVDFNYSENELSLNWKFSPYEGNRGYVVGDYLWTLQNGTNLPDAQLIEIGNPADLVQKTPNPRRSWTVFQRRKDDLEKEAFLIHSFTDPEGVYRLRSASSFLPKQKVEKYLEKLKGKKPVKQLDNSFLWRQDLSEVKYTVEYSTIDSGQLSNNSFTTLKEVIDFIKDLSDKQVLTDVVLIFKSDNILEEQIIYDGNRNLWSFKYTQPEEREYAISQLKDSILGPVTFSKSLNWSLNVNDYDVMLRTLKNGLNGYDFEYKSITGLSFNEIINMINEDNTKGSAENYSSINYIQRAMIENDPERLLPVFIYLSEVSPGDDISLFKDIGVWNSFLMTAEEIQEVKESVTLPNRKYFTDN